MILRPKEDWIAIGIVTLVAILICSNAHAQVDDYKATLAVIGEALPDYDSMYAIACAIRNRDTLKGVYGVNNKAAREASGDTFQLASKAWYMSDEGVDVVNGATHWLSDYDLKHCRPAMTNWRFKYIETAYIGKTHFYIKDSILEHQLYTK